jgi:site-specific recombinase XerD
MLDKYFIRPTRLRQLRRPPLGPHLDDLAADLHRRGFAISTGQNRLALCGRFGAFARSEGVDVSDFDEALAARFIEDLGSEGLFAEARLATEVLLAHLRARGVIAPASTTQAPARDPLRAAYDAYLRDVRGLQPCTREGYARTATRLLGWMSEKSRKLTKLSRADVLTFVSSSLADAPSGSWGKHLTSETRCFLRFLGGEGHAPMGHAAAVPRSARWRLDTIPKHLPWEQVRRLIDSVDVTHPHGMRDKAVLLCLAMLGLRNADVRRMRLADIRWRTGDLHLPQTKSAKARVLPMPHEVGAALADYVLHGRPMVDVPEVFVRHRAPRGPFTTPNGINAIVKEHLRRAGIAAPSRGAHMLRHSMATRLVNAGVPIKTIADVLGHTSIDTTAIYTKVDVTRLAMAALPFPTGGAR